LYCSIVASACPVGDIREIEIEDDFGSAETMRNYEIRIHRVGIDVDHDIWIDPVIPSLLPAGKRTRLQTESIAAFDLVVGVIEHIVEATMQMRHVVAAIEIVIDEDFPIAVEHVVSPLVPMEAGRIEIGDLEPGRPIFVDVHQYPSLPRVDL